MAAKGLAHWLVSGLPLVVLGPLMALAFDLPTDAIGVLVAGLALGTPTLSLIGLIGAALTLGLRGGGVLIALLVLPLYIPVLVFGSGAVAAQVSGLSGNAHLFLLAALLMLSLVFSPWAAASALRVSVE
jgi:heme exporter protein B